MAERIVGHVRVDSGYLLLCDPTRLQAEDFELLRDWFAVIGNHGGMWPDAAPVQTLGGGLGGRGCRRRWPRGAGPGERHDHADRGSARSTGRGE